MKHEPNQAPALPLRAAYAFGTEHGLNHEVDEIRNMDIKWDRSYTSSLRKGLIVSLFEKRGIFEEFKEIHWVYGNSSAGETKRRRYLRIKEEYANFLASRNDLEEAAELEFRDEEPDHQFAAESDLRDFLAKNPTRIESGLNLYQNGDRSGVEFPVENGFIDILAVDRDGRYVVIELKVGKGRNKTIGQLLYYMGWVDKSLGKGPCRGMIIAKEIPDGLMLAVRRVPEVSVLQYHLAVSVEIVSQKD
jgi:Endonuclease NucS